jgi:hypothetical protein
MNCFDGPRLAVVLMAVFGAVCESRADTILGISGSEMVSPGTPVDTLELLDLGIDPNSFLFTGNTFYYYNGTYQVEVIGAEVNPSVTNSLDGTNIQEVLLTIGDPGNSTGPPVTDSGDLVSSEAVPSAVPEPAFTGTVGLALTLSFWWFQRRRSGARRWSS